ncbi:MAG: peptidyl-prolyl cis-trans isomerase, partial [Bacteroidota bacterium]
MKNSLIIFLLVLTACSYLHKNGDRPVARVDDDYLFESDLTDLVAPGTSATDSLNLTRNYIDGWIKKKILIHQAEKNLTEDQLNFSKELEDYRNSLV